MSTYVSIILEARHREESVEKFADNIVCTIIKEESTDRLILTLHVIFLRKQKKAEVVLNFTMNTWAVLLRWAL